MLDTNTSSTLLQDTCAAHEYLCKVDVERVKSRLEELKAAVPGLGLEPCFCHNDLLSGNILMSVEGDARVYQVIDFEYGGVNYREFDIANHWNEYAGGTQNPDGIPDYSLLPDKEQRLLWLREYWAKEDVEKELKDVETFMEINNYYWCLWAVVQSGNEGFEEFDYGRYAYERFIQGQKEGGFC